MSFAANTDLERRIYPRIAVNGQVKYKLEENADYREGLMIDISQTGVQIRLDAALSVDTRLFLRMEADSEQDTPIELTVDVVRIGDTDDAGLNCYGCMILDVREL